MAIDFSLYGFLSILSIFLLSFITVGIIYISYIDWKDKRRK